MEEDCIRRAQAGDTSAFRALVEQYMPVAWQLVRVLTPDAAHAEDALQEAWIDVWRGLSRFAEQGWAILALALQPDHIHLFVRMWPSDSAADVVKECKGITSYHLRKEFPDLLKLPSMWTRSYFAATAGHVGQETIQRSIAAQMGR